MSGYVVGWVFENFPVSSEADRNRKAVLAEVAEAANRNFTNSHPGVARIAERWKLDAGTVRRHLGWLVEHGWLAVVEKGGGRGKAAIYRVCTEAGNARTEYARNDSEKRAQSTSETRAMEPLNARTDPLLTSANASTPVRDTPVENTRVIATTSRKRDFVWEAMLQVCGIDPENITRSARGSYNTAVADLKGANATPASIRKAAAVYRGMYDRATLTPSALAKHYPQCVNEQHQMRERLAADPTVGLIQRIREREGR